MVLQFKASTFVGENGLFTLSIKEVHLSLEQGLHDRSGGSRVSERGFQKTNILGFLQEEIVYLPVPICMALFIVSS